MDIGMLTSPCPFLTPTQITPDLINIINRLYNIIIISKNTYKPWIKVDQIHGILLVRLKIGPEEGPSCKLEDKA